MRQLLAFSLVALCATASAGTITLQNIAISTLTNSECILAGRSYADGWDPVSSTYDPYIEISGLNMYSGANVRANSDCNLITGNLDGGLGVVQVNGWFVVTLKYIPTTRTDIPSSAGYNVYGNKFTKWFSRSSAAPTANSVLGNAWTVTSQSQLTGFPVAVAGTAAHVASPTLIPDDVPLASNTSISGIDILNSDGPWTQVEEGAYLTTIHFQQQANGDWIGTGYLTITSHVSAWTYGDWTGQNHCPDPAQALTAVCGRIQLTHVGNQSL